MLALLGDAEAHGAVLALLSPVLRGAARGRRLRARGRRRRADAAARPLRGQQRRACMRVALAASLRRACRRCRCRAALGARPLLLLPGQAGLLAADLPDARRGRAGRARDARPGRADALRARRAMDTDGRTGRRGLPGRPGARRALLPRPSARYWPALPDGALLPAYAGIRPKISGPGEPAADFLIAGAGRARRGRAGQPVRHRIAGADRLPGRSANAVARRAARLEAPAACRAAQAAARPTCAAAFFAGAFFAAAFLPRLLRGLPDLVALAAARLAAAAALRPRRGCSAALVLASAAVAFTDLPPRWSSSSPRP